MKGMIAVIVLALMAGCTMTKETYRDGQLVASRQVNTWTGGATNETFAQPKGQACMRQMGDLPPPDPNARDQRTPQQVCRDRILTQERWNTMPYYPYGYGYGYRPVPVVLP